MKSVSKIALVAGLLAVFQLAPNADATPFHADYAHSRMSFMAYTKLFDTLGTFSKWKIVKAEFDWNDMSKSEFEISVHVASVDTDSERRDKHLRNEDFFFVKKFPKATFKSTKIKAISDEKLSVTGDLTIKGITKSITIPLDVVRFEKPIKGKKIKVMRLKGKFQLKRKEFGVTYEAGALMPSIKNEVDLVIDLNLVGPKE
ncbi:MAG: YceI family protein [Deltaproteobacteria bacterium]|nr:YceI family protein [Deltaproteobacteria bacterium]